MEENKEIKTEESTISKKEIDKKTSSKAIIINRWHLILGLCFLVILGLLGYIVFSPKAIEEVKINDDKQNDKVLAVEPEKVKEDSVKVTKVEKKFDEYGEEIDPYTKTYIIANSAYLRTSPDKSNNAVETLHFGEVLYVKDFYENRSGPYVEVYKTKPREGDSYPSRYYIATSTLVEEYSFDEFKKAFSLSPFSKLDSKTKKIILDNDYYDQTRYTPTQNADRATQCVAYGDFDNDGLQDVAVILDNTQRQSSYLLVICTNKVTKEPYVAYSKDFNGYYRINSFKKGAKIFKNSSNLVPSPIDGLILQYGSYNKNALLMDTNTKDYDLYPQYSYGDEEN